ncbi:MAG: AEC family transporter [Polaromonas sp.]
MSAILAITGPIYLAIALGYITTRSGLFARADMRVFGQFVIKLALPALLFNALTKREIGEVLNASYVAAYLVGTLVGLPLHGMGRQITPIVLAKLMLHPLAVFVATLALPWVGLAALEPSLRTAAVLLAAMPMMSIYPILAQSYGKEDLGAAALLAGTVASFFTLSGLLWIIRAG